MISELLDFTGRVATVTGGATGIGFATARQFSLLGASTVICSRTADQLEAAAKRISDETGRPWPAFGGPATPRPIVTGAGAIASAARRSRLNSKSYLVALCQPMMVSSAP